MKQKFLKIFIFWLLFISFMNVNAASNPYPKTSSYGTNCTWYAWKIANEKAGVSLPNFGNAKDWYTNAKNAGYTVGTTAKANSIIVWGDWTSYGHVGFVEKVEGNTIYVWDSTGPCIDEEDPEYQECMANGVSEESDKICKTNAKRVACQYSISPSDYTITGYIYLDNVPKATTTKKKETTTIKKSSNAYIKNIQLSVGTINFNKETYNYTLEVENEIENITISAELEDKKAGIIGTGKYELKVGSNEIKLTVSAEDKTKNEYVINITRKEKETPSVTTTQAPKEKNKNNKKQLVIWGISIFLIIIGLFSLVLIKKKGTKKRK